MKHYPSTQLPDLSSREVLDFLLHLQGERKLAGSTLNQAVCALRTFYRDHLRKTWKIWASIKIQPCAENVRSTKREKDRTPSVSNRPATGYKAPAE